VDLVEGRFVGWQACVEMLPPSHRTVFCWMESFNSGQKIVKMGIGPGQMPTASASPAVQHISCVITENRHVIIDKLQLVTSLCHARIHAIILEDIKTKKVFANWVTRDHTHEQKERRVLNCQEFLVHNKDQRGSLPDWLLVLSCGFTIKLWS
jgi:hypothetical protein